MIYPQGQRGQVYAVIVLLMPLILFYNHVVAPAWDDYSSITEDIEDNEFDFLRYQRIANELPALKKTKASIAKLKPLTAYLLSGNNRSLAAATLQRRLQRLVKENDGRILSTRVLKHSQDGAFERISLNARFQLPVASLQKVIHALETGEPYVFVDQINISAKRGRRGSNADELDVRLTVHGLRSPDKGGKRG